MRKNDLVRFSPSHSHIARNIENNSPVEGFNHTTVEDTDRWHENMRKEIEAAKAAGEDTFSIVCDSAGESRLSPRSKIIEFPVTGLFTVIRARVSTTRGYHRVAKQTEILCTITGRQGFVKRELLEKV